MSDRLKDLQRQRALAQEQLEWFDREIAQETGATAPAGKPSAANPAKADGFHVPRAGMAALTRATEADSAPKASAADKEAQEILERFRHVEHPVRDEVKRGCFLYFFVALALLALGLFAFYALKKYGAH